MEFNRSRLMNNILFLIKSKGLKNAAIESQIGISAGYISKMTKAENESMPGIDLIYKLAQIFNVSVEALVNGNLDKSNDNLLFIIRFLHSLQEDTNLHKFEWEQFTNYDEVQEWNMGNDFPMFDDVKNEEVGEDGLTPFQSQFNKKLKLKMSKENYYAFVSGLGIVMVIKLIDKTTETERNIYEVYAIEDGGPAQEWVYPICSTLDCDGDATPYIVDMYNCIVRHAKDLKLEEGARRVLINYFNFREGKNDDLPFN